MNIPRSSTISGVGFTQESRNWRGYTRSQTRIGIQFEAANNVMIKTFLVNCGQLLCALTRTILVSTGQVSSLGNWIERGFP